MLVIAWTNSTLLEAMERGLLLFSVALSLVYTTPSKQWDYLPLHP